MYVLANTSIFTDPVFNGSFIDLRTLFTAQLSARIFNWPQYVFSPPGVIVSGTMAGLFRMCEFVCSTFSPHPG